MKKILASFTAGALLVGAGFAFSAVSTPEIATAQTTTDDGAANDGATDNLPPRATFLDDVLEELVEDGTLTQAQADTVKERLRSRMGEFRGKAPRHGAKLALETAAETLGMTVEELREALHDGQTLAEIAGDQVDELIAAMVAAAEARIDEAVASGKLTTDQADDLRAGLEDRITDHVENGRPADGPRSGFGHGRRGPRGGGFGPGTFGNQNGVSSVEGVNA